MNKTYKYPIQRRRFVKNIFTAALSATGSRHFAQASERQRPNVILMFVDDMAYAALGCYGGKTVPTPHIDSLAKNGVRCTAGYTTGTTCAPSRAGLITGRYQQRFGFYDNWHSGVGVPLTEITFGDVMRDAGYATGWLGKAHNAGAGPAYHPMKRGFDEFYGFLTGSHDYYDVRYSHEPKTSPLLRGNKPTETEDYLTDALSREAVSFIQRHRARPFFLYLAYNAPHGPFQAPARYKDVVYDPSKNEKTNTIHAMVAALDDGVGQVLQALEDMNLSDNTLVFFINDNGGNNQLNAKKPESNYTSDNGPFRGFKGDLYEGGIRVPFIVQWPDTLPAGKDYHEPVSTLDVFSTAAAVGRANIQLDRPIDGVNLIPYLQDHVKKPPHAALYWMGGNQCGNKGMGYAIRKGRYKLIDNTKRVLEKLNGVFKDTDKAELFDLSQDPGEQHDLAASNPKLVAELQHDFGKWMSQIDKPMKTASSARRND